MDADPKIEIKVSRNSSRSYAPNILHRVAAAIYREFENRPAYAQAQMNGVIAHELAVAALRAMRPSQFGDLPENVALAGENAGAGSYSAAHEILAAMIDEMLRTPLVEHQSAVDTCGNG